MGDAPNRIPLKELASRWDYADPAYADGIELTEMQILNAESSAGDMQALMFRLFPICRSITGDGVRETLQILREHIPLEIREVPTGTQVFDWTVPQEWNIRDAWIKNSVGERMIDFRRLNLHVVSYSVPVHQRMRLAELKEHLYTVPHQPDWVPYRTSYYKKSWGFCLSENQLAQLNDAEGSDVCIDSSLVNGHLSYGEYLLKGKEAEEILISCHVCHPSLANDNLSGIAVAVELARHLASGPRRYSYRFLFIPATIGSITWLSLNEDIVTQIRHGLVLTCVGDAGNITYKRSRRGDAEIDRAFIHVLKQTGRRFLTERLESIRRQSFSDWEIIAVDSHSEDGTLETLRQFDVEGSRVHIHQAARDGIYPRMSQVDANGEKASHQHMPGRTQLINYLNASTEDHYTKG